MEALNSFIPYISIASFQVQYYSEALPTTVCVGAYTPKRYGQRRVKYLPKVPMWRLEWDSNLRSSRRKAPNLPPSYHTPLNAVSSTTSAKGIAKLDALSIFKHHTMMLYKDQASSN